MTHMNRELEEQARAVAELDALNREIQALPASTPATTVASYSRRLDQARIHAQRAGAAAERRQAILDARRTIPPGDGRSYRGDGWGERSRPASIRVGEEEPVYRPDAPGGVSFFVDVLNSRQDPEAQERLRRHQLATIDRLSETRDVTTADPGAVGFLPPIYLGEMWAELPRATRPFAEVLPSAPLPDAGLTISIPRVTTGTAVAVQAAQADAVQETDIDTESLSVSVRTIAGQNDVSLQALERTFPGLDFIIFQDLRADYDEQLDTQLLAGTGASGQHLGIRAVTGINTVTYTDASPTGAEMLPKIYNSIEQVASNRFRNPDVIVLHPRRAEWMGKELSSTFPLFQQGSLTQAVGQQEGGFVTSFGGLRVVLDANISTERGASTDEDEIYAVYTPDLVLMEGPLRVRVFEDVLSGTLQVRLQVVAYSAFVSARQPKAITKLSGTGLKAPTWT